MGKKLVLDALYNKETERTPWVPYVGCHGASIINVSAEEYFKSEDLIVSGFENAVKLYRPDGLPALFDLQLEAESMGCNVKYSKDNPPSVFSHPLEEGKAINDLRVPSEQDGRFPLVLNAIKKMKKFNYDVALYGLVTGPFTLAMHLKGTEIFYEMLDEPEKVTELMEFVCKVCKNTARMYIEAGVDIIAIVDPVVSQISPENFEEFVTPYATEIFDYVKSLGIGTCFFVCGNAKRNIEGICSCKPDNISFDENVPISYVKEIAQKYNVSIGGNIKLTLTMLFGTPMDNIQDAMNCIQEGGKKGFILSPGCDMPFATPIENVQAISSYIHGENAQFMESINVLDGIEVEIPDYKNEKNVFVDVITLDSESCAPCQYMMEAVRAAASGLTDNVTVIEHKIKDKESVVFMIKSGVENIPTIVIDGVPVYISIIPAVEDLRAIIVKALEKKGIKV